MTLKFKMKDIFVFSVLNVTLGRSLMTYLNLVLNTSVNTSPTLLRDVPDFFSGQAPNFLPRVAKAVGEFKNTL